MATMTRESADSYFGRLLARHRKLNDLTQGQLAEKIGLNIGSVGQLERGERSPTWKTVVAICRALNVSPEVFLPPEEEKEEPEKQP